jgi:amino acid permease
MSLASVMNLCISLLFFIISFVLSLQANLFLDALYRSFIVFLISFIFFYLLGTLFRQLDRSNQKEALQTETTDQNDHAEEEAKEPEKGEHIDMQTPDDHDDNQFIPLQPRKLNTQDDKAED